jgi:hypothetical protein
LDLKAAAKLLNEREKIVMNKGSVRISSKIAVAYLQIINRHSFRETNITDDVSVTVVQLVFEGVAFVKYECCINLRTRDSHMFMIAQRTLTSLNSQSRTF